MKWTFAYLAAAIACSVIGTIAIRHGRKPLPWNQTLAQRAEALQKLSRTGWRPQRFAWVFILAAFVFIWLAITSR